MTDRTYNRLVRLRERMQALGADLVAFGPSPHTQWALNFHAHSDERLCLLLIGREREAFVMPAMNADAASEHTPVRMFRWVDADGPGKALAEALAFVGAAAAGSVVIDETMRADFALALLDRLPKASRSLASAAIAELRMQKDERDRDGLIFNARIADEAMRQALQAIRPGMTELDVAAVARDSFRTQGATTLFTGVSTGRNGAFPHHATGSTEIRMGDAVMIDIGGRNGAMCSDITRMAIVGTPPSGYVEVHEIVERAVQAALLSARPGVKASDVDKAARQVIADAGYGAYFLHRTGHGIGLEVHEPPYLTETSDDILQTGMTFSIEPGIYLPDRFGIRLEEIVYLGPDGPEIMSSLPRTAVQV